MSSSPASVKDTWALIKPYWFSEDRWKGRALLLTIIVLSLAQVGISVLINQWNARFYNALQDKNLPEFVHQLGVFSLLAGFFIAVAVYRQFFTQMLHIRWRKWMTGKYQTTWLSDLAYYRLQVIYKSTDNPDQRIAEDIDRFTDMNLTLSIGLMSAVVSLASFVTILWGLSGTANFTVGSHVITIPGYMVWVALVYAIFGTWLTHKIGSKLVGLNYERQRFEANYRFSLIRLRENAENIAFYKAEVVESANLTERFSHILQNWWEIMLKQKQLTWFTASYGQIAVIFPFVVASPRYFSGAIQLGGLMQTASAFGEVQSALSWFIDAYLTYTNWKATTNRLSGFTKAIALSNEDTKNQQIRIQHEGQGIAIRDLTLALPDDTVLIEHFNLTLKPGDRLLLSGPSGSGKTTFLRALAGLWPYGTGDISLPADAKTLFVPQKPYLPILPLRDVICYPYAASLFDDRAIADAMQATGLAAFTPHLDLTDNWSQRLSPGEQQKLAFARLLLHKPGIMLLDEATASLDEASEAQLYQLINAKLPDSILISVGHRTTLRAWHGIEKQL